MSLPLPIPVDSSLLPTHFDHDLYHLKDNSPLQNGHHEEAKRRSVALVASEALPNSPEHSEAVLQLDCIPEDIWREIFFHCQSESSRTHLNLSAAPLLLTRVCRKWKSIAIRAPELWTSIPYDISTFQMPISSPPNQGRIYPKKINYEGLTGRGKMLNDWLDRSGMLPISIALGAQGLPLSYRVPQTILDFIHRVTTRDFAPRICSLEVSTTKSPQLYIGFMKLSADDFPNLREITVDKALNIDAGIFHAPRLRKVSIGELPTESESKKISWDALLKQWVRLQHLHIGTPIPEERVFQILGFHHLTECSLTFRGAGTYTTRRISSPNLESLSLSEENMSFFPYEYLDIPALTTLKLKLLGRRNIDNPMLSLLPRINALNKLDLNIERLMHAEECMYSQTLEAFRAIPGLRHLVLHLPSMYCGYESQSSREMVLSLANPRPVRLKEGLEPFNVLPELQILEFIGEIDVLLARYFQNIVIQRLNPNRRDIATLKHISATLATPISVWNRTISEAITLKIRHHIKWAGIECHVDLKDQWVPVY
ncbi:hypothetical protein M413DRAFT_27767 [Hebeloma cylindrosporum]|uniref:F-box domain-containing protein n=1 Tax=Hebeloma cylindrosporum TaxID=76867 RepID=A0A0C3CB19_HEBCY|nr:hypothetical protein M413DRAFT_27767 [Hebeloma cylindrosporum h7]